MEAPIAWEDFEFDEDLANAKDTSAPKPQGSDEHLAEPSDHVSQLDALRSDDKDTEMIDIDGIPALADPSVSTLAERTAQQVDLVNPDIPALPPAPPRRDVAAEIAKLTAEIEEEETRRAAELAKLLDPDQDSDDEDDVLEDLADVVKKLVRRPRVEQSTRVLRGPNTSASTSLPRPAPIAIPVVAALEGGRRFRARLAARALADRWVAEPDDSDDSDSELTPSPTPEPGSQVPRRSSFLRKIDSLDPEPRERWLDMAGRSDDILNTIGLWAQANGPFLSEEFSGILRMSKELEGPVLGIACRHIRSVISRLDMIDKNTAVACIAGLIRTRKDDFEAHIVSLFDSDHALLRRVSWVMLTDEKLAVDYEVSRRYK